MIPYGAGITSALAIGETLNVTPSEATWIAASYPYAHTLIHKDDRSVAFANNLTSLTQGAFVLIGGRVGSVYGHRNLVIVAGVWWTIFTFVSGYMSSFISLCIMRALTGIGGALMVPNAIALLTTTIPPGKKRNISVGLFGAMAPVGAAGGSVFPGLLVQLTDWKWLFFFL